MEMPTASNSNKEPSSKPPSTAAAVQAHETLYIKNLPQKLRNIEHLKRSLYFLATQYGRVIDINISKRNQEQMRGQAHIVYQDVHEAVKAMRSMQGLVFCGRPLHVEYSRSQSRASKILSGELDPFVDYQQRYQRSHPQRQYAPRRDGKRPQPDDGNQEARKRVRQNK